MEDTAHPRSREMPAVRVPGHLVGREEPGEIHPGHSPRLAHSHHHAACPTRSAQLFGNGSLPLSQPTSTQPEHSPENLVWHPEPPALWQQRL